MGSFVDVVVLEIGVFGTEVIDERHISVNDKEKLMSLRKRYNKPNQLCVSIEVGIDASVTDGKVCFK
jgi:hypothetical protein